MLHCSLEIIRAVIVQGQVTETRKGDGLALKDALLELN